MGLALLSSCATPIADFQFCGLNKKTGGAACDNFLISQPKTLDAAGLAAWIAGIQASGQIVELTTSSAVKNIKDEFEKLCTKTSCTYQQEQDIKALVAELDGRIESVKVRALQ